jgi:outer membrane protein assembly factor BamB
VIHLFSMRNCWIAISLLTSILIYSCNSNDEIKLNTVLFSLPSLSIVDEVPPTPSDLDSIHILNSTFLGGEARNYYGDFLDTSLCQLWKHKLGQGETNLAKGRKTWSGAGWTGQPLIVKEKDSTYLIIGCYDHHLKKINSESGRLIWQYKYDDVIKGTGTIIRNDTASNPENRFVILQGSRRGLENSLSSKHVFSYRAISYLTGKELWRMNIPRDKGWSRDVDASALILNDTAYIGLENGIFRVFDPFTTTQENDHDDHWTAPKVYQEHKLYRKEDKKRHGGNLVTESSPAKLGNHVYIASGSGHLFGYNLDSDSIDFDFFIGSDIDGSPVITSDGCIIVTAEKQYIKGHGGVFKIDPNRPDTNCVVWFYPTGDRNYADWKGGIIGSACINDSYSKGIKLAAVTGIDGILCVFDHMKLADSLVEGPNKKHLYPSPKVVFRKYIGPSISTPIFTEKNLLAAGYKGLSLFQYDSTGITKHIKTIKGVFEATPSINQGNVFIASRNGYLYCFGKSKTNVKANEDIAPVEADKKIEEVVESITAEEVKELIPAIVSSIAVNSIDLYHVIVGTYHQKYKAERFAVKLKEMNLIPIIFKKGSLYYLSAKSSPAQEILEQDVNTIASLTNTSAWILKSN